MHSVDKFAFKQSERILVSILEQAATIDHTSETTKTYLDALMLLNYQPTSKK